MTAYASKALFLLCLILAVSASHALGASPRADDDSVTFEMPLEQGRIDLAELLREGLRSAGMKPSAQFENQSWPIDVSSTLGKLQLRAISKLTDSVIDVRVSSDKATVTIDRAALKRNLNASQSWLNDLLGTNSGAAPSPSRVFGMFIVEKDDSTTLWRDATLETVPDRVTILVHGLDDPGWMWDDMITSLRNAGPTPVDRFEYPNDGPISEAADLLAMELQFMRACGVERVNLVAHSMGGLVCRDVLTRPAYYHGDGTGGANFPAVDHLIMLGTPNHGSHLARLRAVTELQEHVTRTGGGNGSLLDSLHDGDGEAAVDLTPGSLFLRRLNERPLPTHTKITNVAGKASPIDSDEAKRALQRIQKLADTDLAPSWLRQWMRDAGTLPIDSWVDGLIDGLGDGAVTLESTKLAGVEDYVVIDANHVSMIVNTGETIAPGIAIVLTRLREE